METVSSLLSSFARRLSFTGEKGKSEVLEVLERVFGGGRTPDVDQAVGALRGLSAEAIEGLVGDALRRAEEKVGVQASREDLVRAVAVVMMAAKTVDPKAVAGFIHRHNK